MDDQLPETRSDQPPASRPEGTRELVVSGTEVYLPDSKRIRPGDPDFKVIVAEVLPEYAPSLSEPPRKYPWWAVILILVFFGSLFAGLYRSRPQMSTVTTSLEVPPPEITTYKGVFFKEYREAGEYVDARKYEDARKCLEPVIDKLLAQKERKPEDEQLFYTYFGLFNYLPWNNEAGERAKAQLDELIGRDSNYRWKLFEFQYQLNRMGGEDLGRYSRHATAASLDKIMGRIDDLRKEQKKAPAKVTRQLDLYKCYFGLKAWRLKNGNKPDDSLGVDEREKVWKIASKEEYEHSMEFAEVRRYLVRQLMKEKSYRYTFDGEVHWTRTRLENELEKVDREIKKLKKETK